MIKLTDNQIIEFFKKSYTSVDGLWFMKTEELFGFEKTLKIDEKVWQILPKIQARMLKPMSDSEDMLFALIECLTTKMSLEGFSFKIEDNIENKGKFSIIIDDCPWYNLMKKSNRAELSGKFWAVICDGEYRVWTKEFSENISFELGQRICGGCDVCILNFSR